MDLVLLGALMFCWMGGIAMGLAIAYAIWLQLRPDQDPDMTMDVVGADDDMEETWYL